MTSLATRGVGFRSLRGRRGGRKPVVTGEKLERARALISKGLTVREAATRLRVGKTALYEALRARQNQAPQPRVGSSSRSVRS
jgi:DNA invertase Pin-like site-specific DNA recombinase